MRELIQQYIDDKKDDVYVNGYGAGQIKEIQEDFLTFVVLNINTSKKEKSTYEVLHIPINENLTISEGQKDGLPSWFSFQETKGQAQL